MGDTKTDRAESEPRITTVLNLAERAFWEFVEEQYHEVEPHTTIRNSDAWCEFRRAARAAIGEWLRANAPITSPVTARCDFEVQMRPPKKGERAWMVESLTAEDALEEILRESEDLGWTADKNYNDAFDEHGMHAVTIVLKRPLRASTQDELMKAQGFPVIKVPAGAPLGTVTAGRFTSDCSGVGPVVSGKSEWAELTDKLTPYNGWKATFDYPGYINWRHPDIEPFVCATPDFHEDGQIAIDVQTNDGMDFNENDIPGLPEADLFWPVGATRTPGTYVGVVGPVLDLVFAKFAPNGERAQKRAKVVELARVIESAMNEIVELTSDPDINDLICEKYPRDWHSLDEVAHDVNAWRFAMKEAK